MQLATWEVLSIVRAYVVRGYRIPPSIETKSHLGKVLKTITNDNKRTNSLLKLRII